MVLLNKNRNLNVNLHEIYLGKNKAEYSKRILQIGFEI